MQNIITTPEQKPQQNSNGTLENLPSLNPEKLPHNIKVFRTMSSTEFHKFLDGEQMRPIVEKSENDLQDITTADTSAIWFTPDKAEFFCEPQQDDNSLASEELTGLDFKEVCKIWNLGRGGPNDATTNNLIVEFSTDKRPGISYGKYGKHWVKEYTYKEYDKDDFQVQRVYNLSDGEVVFDRMQFRDFKSAEEALANIADNELAREQDMEKAAIAAREILKKYASQFPSPY